MTEQVKQFLSVLRSGEYKKRRVQNEDYDLTEVVAHLPRPLVNTVLVEDMLKRETPNLLEGDPFGFNRSLEFCPIYYNEKGKRVRGTGGNLTPNYSRVIDRGFEEVLAELDRYAADYADDEKKQSFYEAMSATCWRSPSDTARRPRSREIPAWPRRSDRYRDGRREAFSRPACSSSS